MQRYTIHIVFYIPLLLVLFACNEKNTEETGLEDSLYKAEDEAFANWLYMDIISKSHYAIQELFYAMNPALVDDSTTVADSITCPKTSFTGLDAIDKTIFIDYGARCQNLYTLNVRKNDIVVNLKYDYPLTHNNIEITLNNYTFNNISISGKIDITNNKTSGNGTGFSQVTLNNGEIHAGDTLTITREFDYTYFWMAGSDTSAAIIDDYVLIGGSASGNHSQFGDYESIIADTLEYSFTCPYIVRGIYSLNYQGEPEILMNYGYSTCENLGKITAANKKDEFQIRYNFARLK